MIRRDQQDTDAIGPNCIPRRNPHLELESDFDYLQLLHNSTDWLAKMQENHGKPRSSWENL